MRGGRLAQKMMGGWLRNRWDVHSWEIETSATTQNVWVSLYMVGGGRLAQNMWDVETPATPPYSTIECCRQFAYHERQNANCGKERVNTRDPEASRGLKNSSVGVGISFAVARSKGVGVRKVSSWMTDR